MADPVTDPISAIPAPFGDESKKHAIPASIAAPAVSPDAAHADPIRPATASDTVTSGIRPVHDVGTGKDLLQTGKGDVVLHNTRGDVLHVPLREAGKLLNDPTSGYRPATSESLDAAHKDEIYKNASFAEKSDWVARTALTGVADGVAPIARAAAGVGSAVLGVENPIEESLNGEKLVEHLDHGIAKVLHGLGLENEDPDTLAARSASNAQTLGQAAPVAHALIHGGGMLLGGGLAAEAGAGIAGARAAMAGDAAVAAARASKVEEGAAMIAKSLGASADKAAKLGKYAEQVATGAGINLAAESENAWVNNEKLSAEAQLHALGTGALWGAGGQLAADAIGAGARVAKNQAAKVFGKLAESGSTGADEAAAALAEGITGSKPSSTFAEKLQGTREWLASKIEAAQARATGASEADLAEVGALRNTERAKRAQEMYAKRDVYLEDHSRNLTKSLSDLHADGAEIYEQARNMALKRENIAKLIADADHAPMLEVGQAQAAKLRAGLLEIKNSPELLGRGKATADLVHTYEKGLDALRTASSGTDVFMALDEFKRGVQRAEAGAAKGARNAQYGIDIEHAQNRMRLAYEVSENTRNLLESETFGKAGEAQKAINSQFNEMLRTDRFVQGKTMQQVGEVNKGLGFGAPKYAVDPDKIRNVVDGLGTTKSQTIEQFMRENVVARKNLAQAMVDHYQLEGAQLSKMKSVISNADASLKTLDTALADIGDVNKIDAIHAAQAKNAGHGTVGAMIAAMAGHAIAGAPGGALAAGVASKLAKIITQPGTLIDQAIAARHAVAKASSLIDGAINGAVNGAKAAAPAVRKSILTAGLSTAAVNARANARFNNAIFAANQMQTDPEHMINQVGALTGHIEHPELQAATTNLALNSVNFIISKIPPPLYKNSVPNAKAKTDLASVVSATQRDEFLSYVDAAHNPFAFFSDLANGTATPQQAETAKVLIPNYFQYAQTQAITQFANGKTAASYQQRLKVQKLLSLPIEPTTSASLQQFIAQSAAQAGQSTQQSAPSRSSSKPSKAAERMRGPLDDLHI